LLQRPPFWLQMSAAIWLGRLSSYKPFKTEGIFKSEGQSGKGLKP
jgi:hypothetical protein